MKRLFLAIPLSDEAKLQLSQKVERMQPNLPFQNWVHEEDYHVTLHFLGECRDQKVNEIITLLRSTPPLVSNFTLQIGNWGIFGREHQPRILWAGFVDLSSPLVQLQKHIIHLLSPMGFPPDDRPYRPHITVARKYQLENFSEGLLDPFQMESSLIEWNVSEYALYESNLGKKPMYDVIARFPLQS